MHRSVIDYLCICNIIVVHITEPNVVVTCHKCIPPHKIKKANYVKLAAMMTGCLF